MNTVEFPGLGGLQFTLNQVALKIGEIPIYWYGIIIAAAFMTAVILAMRQSEKFGINQENLIDLILFAAPAGIIGARLYYVIFTWDSYRDDPMEIFKIWHGGLGIYGGIIFGIITAYFVARAKKIKPLHLLDFAVPYIAIAQAIGRWGNFVNQEAFGINTRLPWGMTSETVRSTLEILSMQGMDVNPDIPVHPTFLYESIWDLAIFALLIWHRKRKKADGEVVCLYMVLYGLGRFFIEGLRTDSLMLGNLRISQVLAAVFVILFTVLIFTARKRAERLEESGELGTSEYGAVLANLREEERQNTMEQGDGSAEEVEEGTGEQDDSSNEEAGEEMDEQDDGFYEEAGEEADEQGDDSDGEADEETDD